MKRVESQRQPAAHFCMFVDDVPVLFGGGPYEPYNTWYRPLGKRKRWGIWTGTYPLEGDVLAESMRLYNEEVKWLIPVAFRRE